MNTSKLKKFARSARSKLMAQVAAKLEFVLTADSAMLREKAEQISKLREEIDQTGKAHLIEKVAYTWFNRLVALRFMDVNDFQPLGLRIVTPKNGFTLPEILDEAKRGNFPPEFNIQHSAFKITRIEDLLYGKIPSSNPQNEVYRELLIAACNHLNTVFPFLFERINDYTELLLPDDLTSDFSILNEIREGMYEEDCTEVEIIGWLYQFYIAEKKDEVYASKSKVKKEDIPAVTQLFTPRWIVEYMVQNTVGKLWLQNRPNSGLKQFMPYYIQSASSQAEDYLKINSPEEITLLDPAMGSGHILVYGFELLTRIYEEEGYNHSDIPGLIISNNLFGLEIDERAAQLAGFALMMKARQYHRRFFNEPVAPKTVVLEDILLKDQEIKDTFAKINLSPSRELLHDLSNMQQASNFGSLIIPHAQMSELERVIDILASRMISSDLFLTYRLGIILLSVNQLIFLCTKYTCVVTNPPYLGNYNTALGEFVKTNYPDSKADLMACFMESGLMMLKDNCFLGMINMHSWMFLSSYQKLRKKIIENINIASLLHLGPRTFPEISGEVVQNASFIFEKKKPTRNGIYLRLIDIKNSEQKRKKTILSLQSNQSGLLFNADQYNFAKIPGNQIGYWLSQEMISLFEGKLISDYAESGGRCKTHKDIEFVRYWWEISSSLLNIKWKLYNKGGENIKWYGNLYFVINWSNEAKRYYSGYGGLSNKKFWNKIGITWSGVSGSGNAYRIKIENSEYASASPTLILNESTDIFELLGFLNSKLSYNLMMVINPTLQINVGDALRLPYEYVERTEIGEFAEICVNTTKELFNEDENSFEFQSFPLYNESTNLSLREQLKSVELNFIDRSMHVAELEQRINYLVIKKYRGILSDINTKEGHKSNFINDICIKLISYSVGCMMGRYSLDKDGLILANQGETLKEYLDKVGKSKQDIQFLPDEDNIIPILEDEWFEDDITGRFHQFLKVTFGTENFSKNISFVEECLGKDVRNWFVKDFYSDHIRRYKKRPIYWMFSSPNGSFNVLIYMHHYTPDTLNLILNKYLRPFQDKLRARREYLVSMQGGGQRSAVGGLEIAKAMKEQDKIDKILLELKEYEREIFYPLALERIKIDLDDGVLVNYNKFGKAVKLVPGLNDPETKKKVKGFDWIDGSQII